MVAEAIHEFAASENAGDSSVGGEAVAAVVDRCKALSVVKLVRLLRRLRRLH